MNNIAAFVKFKRKQLDFTQEELAQKAGVGLRFLRELEQGKKTLRLDKVEQVLQLFGFQLSPSRQQLDPYLIWWKYRNKIVKITLVNKLVKYGLLVGELIDEKEGKIMAWKFVPTNKVIQYLQKTDDSLTETVLHADIANIENH